MPKPIVMTDEDFADHRHIRGYDDKFVLVLAHTNLLDEKAAAPDEPRWEQSKDFFQMALRIAEEFPEVQVGLFNSRNHEFMARRLSVLFSFSTYECWALVFCGGYTDNGTSAGYNETPETFRTWLLGMLLEGRYRSPESLDQAVIWLAYNLCQHRKISYDTARWDDEDMRMQAVETMRQNFMQLQRQWHSFLEHNAEMSEEDPDQV